MAHDHSTNSADGTEIRWSSSGQGKPVVLVHGITENSSSWDPVLEQLTDTNRVITLDLRGHGQSGTAARYDLEAMAGDVASVISSAGADMPHVVGHSLGGIVVSALGANLAVGSITNVDQSLQLGGFKEQLGAVEGVLRDPASFPSVIEALFDGMRGPKLNASEADRLNALRRPDQEVVLGVWDLIFSMPADEIQAVVDGALGGYASSDTPYLSLFGIDPGPDYAAWLGGHIPNAAVELWPDHGHYPHLVDAERFVSRLHEFWAQ